MDPSNPAPLPPVPPNIGQVTSPIIFGLLFSWALYGILTVQVYLYHLCFEDKKGLRYLVYAVYLLDTLQTILTGFDANYWFGSGFGNVVKLSNPYASAFDSPMLDGLLSLIVQWYFCYRIWVLSGRGRAWYLPVFIGLVALTQTTAAFISGVRGHIVGDFAIARAHIDLVALYIWLIGSVVADVLIAISMIYLLLKSRSDFEATNALLTRLIRIVLETNLLTAIVAFVSLVLYFSLPDKNYFICPLFFLGKLYSNTLLVTLNNRVFIGRNTRSRPSTGSSQMHLPRFALGSESGAMQLDTLHTYTDFDTTTGTSKHKSHPSM